MYICPGDFILNYFKISKDILASKRHTQGNSDTEFLWSLEDPEKIFRKRDKEKIDISLFGASSSQDFHRTLDQEWEINVEKGLLKSKSESDLKKLNSTLVD